MNQLLAMRAFTRVIETGSFSRAADQLALPRSTISKLVGDLEAHLGVKLLHRTTRAIATTPEGLAYYHNAARLIADVDAADASARSGRLSPSGHLRVDAPSVFADRLLIPWLPDFARRYPEVTISLGISDRTVNIVGEGVDCAIRAGTLSDSALIARSLFAMSYVTCAAPAYLDRKGVPTSPEALRPDHDLVGYFFAATNRAEPLIFAGAGEVLQIGDCRYSANDGNGHNALMLAGLGIGQTMRAFVQEHINAGRLIPVLEDWHRHDLSFTLIYPPNRLQSARLKVFVEWLIGRVSASKESDRDPAQ